MKKRVLSGIRATGRLHLGNYLGAVRGMLELQNPPTGGPNYETLYMVADLHAITTPYDPKKLPQNTVILELPIKLWNMEGHEIESIRSLYSLEHGKRRVGGFSGFAPLAWIDLVEKINANGLNQENTNRLHSLGVTHVIENNILRPL